MLELALLHVLLIRLGGPSRRAQRMIRPMVMVVMTVAVVIVVMVIVTTFQQPSHVLPDLLGIAVVLDQ
jgi:hypothetical protein